MQFANSDIEDLKIVDEENSGSSASSSAPAASAKQSSIHDDPAIVSAVVSGAAKKEMSLTSRLVEDLQHLALSHGQHSKKEGRFSSHDAIERIGSFSATRISYSN